LHFCLLYLNMIENIRQIIAQEAEAIRNIPVTREYEQCIDIIYNHIHLKKGKLVTSGMGKAGQIALNIATTLSSTGTPSIFLHPSDSQHGDLGVIQENDVLLLVSNSGKTREILELVNLASRLYTGLPLIVITGDRKSELATKADVCLYTGGPEEVCPLRLTPSTSTTTMTVIGDILMVLMMQKIGFTSEDYAKRHHGGYLGDKSRQQAAKG
jgi:arabinose-5-phosphate isomerase